MQSVLSFPPIGACIFDMDVLLINSEDIITLSMNQELEKYGRPVFTRGRQIFLLFEVGVADSINSDTFYNWDNLTISREQFTPLASGTKTHIYELKTSKPKNQRLLSFFQADRGVLGDGPWVQKGRGKPAPYIYQASALYISSQKPISPNECLRRAGTRVVWIPHPDLAAEYQSIQKDVLAGQTEMNVETHFSIILVFFEVVFVLQNTVDILTALSSPGYNRYPKCK
ncbi:HAD-like protein [Xylaria longipes]|nr:HAD-like protein [Xylaria longipes]